MAYLLLKAAISGLLIAVASEVARRNAAMGALVASLPLISILGVIWLWRDTADPARIADHMAATLWYIAPSLPMFVLVPYALRHGWGFWLSLGAGCTLTLLLYLATVLLARRWGIQL
jgi:hypothetical protein